MVARVAGAAVVAIAVSCWLERNRDHGGPRSGLVAGLLVYNVAVPLLLAHAFVFERARGVGLWPACGLHAALAIWCIASLRSRPG